MFDAVQAPSLWHALELMTAAIAELNSGLGHQIPDRARRQDLAGARLGGDARADMKRETDHVRAAHFVLARVQPDPDLQPQRAHGLLDRGGATNPGNWCCERRQQSVTRRDDFLSAQSLHFFADRGVIVIHYPRPARIAELGGFCGGLDDVDKENRDKRLLELGIAIGGSPPRRDASRQ